MKKSIEVSIVLLNFRNVKLTIDCIRSILNAGAKVSYEIIVVDNHSEDGSLEALNSQFPQLTIIDSGKNGGFAYGNNVGVRRAVGKYLLLLNNDTEVKPGMLDELYQYAQSNSDVGMLGCRSVDRNGVELPVTHQYENLKRIWLQTYIKPLLEKVGLQRRLVHMAEHRDDVRSSFVPAQWIAGSAMFIRRELYYQLGGLDENFFMYMEDEDLCRRVNMAGYKVGIIPILGYVHYCGGSTIQSYFLTKEYMKSRLIFFMRYEPHDFARIKRQLFRQISAVNKDISHDEIRKMQDDLEQFISDELPQAAQYVKKISD